MDDKIKDVKFIRGFNKITLKKICNEEKVDRNNFYKLEVSKEKIHNMKLNIDKKLKELYEDYDAESTL